MFLNIGEIDLSKGKVDITDPCYDKDVWCRLNSVDILPGAYSCYAEMRNFPYTWDGKTNDDHRIARLMIVHEGCDIKDELVACDYIPDDYIGEIGVDAGLAGFFDCKPDFSDDEWERFCDDLFEREGPLEHSDVNRHVKVYGKSEFGFSGVVSSSGFGDGGYPVFVERDKKGRVECLVIEFIEEDYEND